MTRVFEIRLFHPGLPVVVALLTSALLGATLAPIRARADERAAQATLVEEFPGVVRAARKADISPRFDGLLQWVGFSGAEVVTKGQKLFQFLTLEQEYILKVEQAVARRAAAALRLAEAELERAKALRKRGVNSEADLDEAVAKRDVAAATLSEADTKVEMREIIIREHSLYAPFDGIATASFVNEGTYITKEARETSRLATVFQLDPIHVEAEVPYEVYARRHPVIGSESAMPEVLIASIILPDGTEYKHPGRFLPGVLAFDEARQTITSTAEFPNPERFLRPGLRIRIRSVVKTPPSR